MIQTINERGPIRSLLTSEGGRGLLYNWLQIWYQGGRIKVWHRSRKSYRGEKFQYLCNSEPPLWYLRFIVVVKYDICVYIWILYMHMHLHIIHVVIEYIQIVTALVRNKITLKRLYSAKYQRCLTFEPPPYWSWSIFARESHYTTAAWVQLHKPNIGTN